jgi:glycerol-3-phosphate dehydrogenase (NAD(P)+)
MIVQNPQPTIAILGAGAWGAALTTLAKLNGHSVYLWSRQGNLALAEAIAHCDILISAISMKGVPETVAKIQALGLAETVVIASATKGLDAATLQTPSRIWQTAFPHNPLVVMSGPNLSQEIEAGLPAATVVASTQAQAAEAVQQVFACDRFRIYTNNDPVGTECDCHCRGGL